MNINKMNTNQNLLKDIAGSLGHVYYSITLEVGADIESKAVKAEIIGKIDSVLSIPFGEDAFFNHRLCMALNESEAIRLKEVLNNALNSLSEYEIELRVDSDDGKLVWVLNRGKFFKVPETGRICQYGFIANIPAKMLKRNEFGTADDRYHRLAGLMNDYVFSVRRKDGEIVETIHGGACNDVTGYSEQDFLDDSDLWFKMVHPRDKDLILERANKMARGEKVDELVHRIKHKNGDTRWVKSVIVPHHDEFGNIFLYDGVIRDITEQTLEQHRLEQIAYMNELLLDATPYPMILMQNDGVVIKANKAGYEMGAKDEETCSTMWKKEIDATCEFRSLLDKSMAQDSIFVGEISYQGIIYEVTIVPNEPDLLLACLHDITTRKEMSDRLEEDKMIMQAVFDNTIASIMLLDTNGKFEAINSAASKIIDFSQAEITGLTLYEVFPREEAQKKMEYIQQVTVTHKALHIEEALNGYELDSMVIPVVDKNSEVNKVAIFSKDNTKMKKAEENLVETYQILTTIIENSPLIIMGLNNERRVVLWNRMAEIESDIKASEAYGKVIEELYSSTEEVLLKAIEEAYAGRQVDTIVATTVKLDGTKSKVRLNISPKRDAQGKVNGVIIMANPID